MAHGPGCDKCGGILVRADQLCRLLHHAGLEAFAIARLQELEVAKGRCRKRDKDQTGNPPGSTGGRGQEIGCRLVRGSGCSDLRRLACLDRQSEADAGDRLDRETAVGFRHAADLGDTAVDRVLADDPPGPARLDQLVPRDDLAAASRQLDQHLHDAGFQDLALPAGHDFARRRPDLEISEREVRLLSQIDGLRPFGSSYRHAVGNRSARDPGLQAAGTVSCSASG